MEAYWWVKESQELGELEQQQGHHPKEANINPPVKRKTRRSETQP